ncbi:MAG TPA: putative Ig domain-containing protein [Nitrospiria bacterium]|nr:putative Ig domain-containing protein [Nitrospiria bacterium]
MKIVTIDKEPKSTPSRDGTRRSSGTAESVSARMRRVLVALLSIGAVFALGWMISVLTRGAPNPAPLSSPPMEANRATTSLQKIDGPSRQVALPAPEVNNYPPKILSVEIAPLKPHLGDELEARATAFDQDGDPVQLSYTWLVNGQIVTQGNSPRLAGSDLHKHDRVVVRVVPSDGKSNGVEASSQPVFVINRPPQITSSPSMTVEGGIYTYNVKALDPDGDPLQFRLSQSPEGMTIDPGTGIVQWRVSAEHPSVDVGVVVSDGDGAEAYQQFKLTVHSGS